MRLLIFGRAIPSAKQAVVDLLAREPRPTRIVALTRTGLQGFAMGHATSLGIETSRYPPDFFTHQSQAYTRALEQAAANEPGLQAICIAPQRSHCMPLLEACIAAQIPAVVGTFEPGGLVWTRVPANKPTARSGTSTLQIEA